MGGEAALYAATGALLSGHGMGRRPRSRRRLWGTDGVVNLNDTWDWDGQSWAKPVLTTSPPTRFLSAMAYDAVRGRSVLFGGKTSRTEFLDDTWELATVRAPGSSCAAGHQCGSGVCAGGVCCPSQCASASAVCESCNPAPDPRALGVQCGCRAGDPSGFVAFVLLLLTGFRGRPARRRPGLTSPATSSSGR